MECIVVLLLFLLVVFSILIKRKWSNLLTVFLGMYAVISFLPSLQLFGLYKASDEAYCMVLLGCFSYMVGYLVLMAVYQKKKELIRLQIVDKLVENREVNADNINIPLVKIALILVISATIYNFYDALKLISSGMSFARLRALYFYGGIDYGRTIWQLYLLNPLSIILSYLGIIMFFDDGTKMISKLKYYLLPIMIACSFLRMLTHGGRAGLFYSMIIILFFYIKSVEKRKNQNFLRIGFHNKNKKALLSILVIILAGVIFMTIQRSRSGNDNTYIYQLARTGYIYFSGWLPNFGLRIEEISSHDLTYGYSFILGLIKIPAKLLHQVIPSSDLYSIADKTTTLLQERMDVGEELSFNAYVSLFYYFYLDFGWFGVLMESFLFGIFCSWCELKYEIQHSYYSRFMYIVAFSFIIYSMIRWPLTGLGSALVIYLSPFFFMHYKIRRSN